MIRVLYFASLREQLGTGAEELESAPALDTLDALARHLAARGGDWADAFGEGRRLLMALNQQTADLDTPLKDGDEAAFFPPVTGG